MTPAAATNVTEGFGFTISWNVPEVEPAFIEGYEVFINRADLRRWKRQKYPIRIPIPADVTSYTFTTDEAFTDFLVRVDGLLRVSGQRGRVPALIETRLRTSEGSELYTEHERLMQSLLADTVLRVTVLVTTHEIALSQQLPLPLSPSPPLSLSPSLLFPPLPLSPIPPSPPLSYSSLSPSLLFLPLPLSPIPPSPPLSYSSLSPSLIFLPLPLSPIPPSPPLSYSSHSLISPTGSSTSR